MQRSLARHLPSITSRIEFLPSVAAGSQPVITPRIDFDEEWALPTNNGPRDPLAIVGFDKNLEDEELSVVTEDDDDVEELLQAKSNNSKIPKPQGEPGRPNCGGYNIESELRGWSPDLLENVTVSINGITYYYI